MSERQPEIVLEGSITPEDSMRAWKFFKRRLLWGYRIFGVLLIVAGVVSPFVSGGAKYLVPLALAGLAGGLAYPEILALFMKAVFKRNSQLYGNHVLVFSEDGYTAKNPNMESKQDWSYWKRFEESAEDFLLVGSKEMFQAVPKRFFKSNTDLARFRELLAKKI